MNMIWDITYKCNLKCTHCGAIKFKKNERLDNKQKIIKYISPFVKQIDLLGGEPLTNPFVFNIINNLKENKIKVRIITNGQFSDDIAKKLIDTKIDVILVSIDGLDNENDKIRGIGSWKNAISFIQSLIKYNKVNNLSIIGVNVVLNKKNFFNIDKLIDYLSTFDIQLIQINPLITTGRCEDNKNELIISEDLKINTYEKISKHIINNNINNVKLFTEYPLITKYLNQKYGTNFPMPDNSCRALIDTIYCDPNGNITPCRRYKTESISNETATTWNNDFNIFDDFLNKTCLDISRENCNNCDCYEICFQCPLDKKESKPLICKIIDERYKYWEGNKDSTFKLVKPYSLIEKDNLFFIYNPILEIKTQYTKEGFNILNSIIEPKTIKEINKITSIPCEIIYRFLLQEKQLGKIIEINN